jgi:hypothetical protein
MNSLRPFTPPPPGSPRKLLGSAIRLLDVVVIKKKTTLTTRIYGENKHTGRYLNFHSNCLTCMKIGLIEGLHIRGSTICQEEQDL